MYLKLILKCDNYKCITAPFVCMPSAICLVRSYKCIIIPFVCPQQSVVMAMGPYNGPFHLYILKAVNGHLDGSTLWTYIGDQSVFSLSHQISAQVLADTGGALAVIDSYKTDTSFEVHL